MKEGEERINSLCGWNQQTHNQCVTGTTPYLGYLKGHWSRCGNVLTTRSISQSASSSTSSILASVSLYLSSILFATENKHQSLCNLCLIVDTAQSSDVYFCMNNEEEE